MQISRRWGAADWEIPFCEAFWGPERRASGSTHILSLTFGGRWGLGKGSRAGHSETQAQNGTQGSLGDGRGLCTVGGLPLRTQHSTAPGPSHWIKRHIWLLSHRPVTLLQPSPRLGAQGRSCAFCHLSQEETPAGSGKVPMRIGSTLLTFRNANYIHSSTAPLFWSIIY